MRNKRAKSLRKFALDRALEMGLPVGEARVVANKMYKEMKKGWATRKGIRGE